MKSRKLVFGGFPNEESRACTRQVCRKHRDRDLGNRTRYAFPGEAGDVSSGECYDEGLVKYESIGLLRQKEQYIRRPNFVHGG